MKPAHEAGVLGCGVFHEHRRAEPRTRPQCLLRVASYVVANQLSESIIITTAMFSFFLTFEAERIWKNFEVTQPLRGVPEVPLFKSHVFQRIHPNLTQAHALIPYLRGALAVLPR